MSTWQTKALIPVIDSSNDDIIHTITLGNGNGNTQPRALDVNPYNGHIYLANIAADTLSEIDGQTNNILKNIPVGSLTKGQGPNAVAFNTFNNKVYVANVHADNVAVIDTSIGKVIESIPVGQSPEDIVLDSNNGNMYTTNYLSKTVSVISTSGSLSPRNTAITSTIDGNGNAVQDGGLTVSTSITFQVAANPGTNPIAGFECGLDGSPFSSCVSTSTNSGTISYDNLEAGQQHTFKVRAVDAAGNKDPTPATFTWTILTSKQAVQNIIVTIENMHVSKGTTTSLEAPLNNAIRQLDRNHNGEAACNTLNAFLHQVDAKQTNGRLTLQQAADLRQQAIAIQNRLGCSSTSSSSSSNEIALPH